MPVKVINTELGHSLPPEAPHNITFHIPGWDTAKALRRGDPELLGKLSSIYPRFGPWCEVRQLANLLHKTLSLPETHGVILFSHPDAFSTAQHYSTSSFRDPETARIPPEQLLFRVVDIPILSSSTPSESPEIIRLYAICYPLSHARGAVGVWQNHGTGISSRLAAALLPAAETNQVTVLDFRADGTTSDVSPSAIPPSSGLPLGPGHSGLRDRIAELVDSKHGVTGEDVWLYPTGMAAIWRLHRALTEVRGKEGKVVVLGSVFHNSWHVFEESQGGMKHFGACEGMMEELDAWLNGEYRTGRRVKYIFAEFPSNPVLASVDLGRLTELADKYDVPVVIDDTIGSFCNIDVLPVADVVITSITKSVSGYANVMGGSLLLRPTSSLTPSLKRTLTTSFLNEYFHADAAHLLSNTSSYLPRSAILNRNALALATFLENHRLTSPQNSPITSVLYPPFTPTHQNYVSVMRPPTKDFTPGYGCLLSVQFPTIRIARAFYDHLSVYHGPHLGAHHTLAFPFNDAIWGADPEAAAYLASFGVGPEQVRVSVGLEEEEELIDTFKEALRWAEEEMAKETKGE